MSTAPAILASLPAPAVLVYQGELDYLSRFILDSPDIETGGELFGFWTASGLPVVLYVLGPGPRANHQVAFFNQDLGYLTRVGDRLISRYGLQHIGEWHSHHQLGLAHPSGHDASTMVRSIAGNDLGRFLLCIGNCTPVQSTVNAFAFHQDAGYDYCHAAWDVKPGPSPFRALVDVDPDLAPILCHPDTPRPAMGPLYLADGAPRFTVPSYSADYWLNDRRNNLALKQILDFLSESLPDAAIAPKLDSDHRVVLRIDAPDHTEDILFPEGFPFEPPQILVPVPAPPPPPRGFSRLWIHPDPPPPPPPPPAPTPDWFFSGDIFQAFRAWWTARTAPVPSPAPSDPASPPDSPVLPLPDADDTSVPPAPPPLPPDSPPADIPPNPCPSASPTPFRRDF